MHTIRFAVSVAIASALYASAACAQAPESAQDKRIAASKSDGWSSEVSSAQKMKNCLARQSAKSPDMSKSDMTKACNDEMKMQKDKASVTKTVADTPKDADTSAAASPK